MCDKIPVSIVKKSFSFFNSPTGKIKIVNEDDHPILFELCGEGYPNKKQWVPPNECMKVKFDPNRVNTWICKAWFNGVTSEPMEFNAWEGKNIKLMVRKDDGIYKSNYDGTDEKVHIKFMILRGEEHEEEDKSNEIKEKVEEAEKTPFDEPTILISQLKLLHVIGSGNTSNVWLGHYKEKHTTSNSQYLEVAVKKILFSKSGKDEIELMRNCRHKNIVEFIGWAKENDNIVIISEYMNGGNLHSYLSNPLSKPKLGDCFSYISQILEAMIYLNSIHIIHRDLAARNCLLNSTYELLKISDFGLSRKTDVNYEYVAAHNIELPYRWLPIEAFGISASFTAKGDVWAFGVTAWEIFERGAIPYEGHNMQSMVNFLRFDGRLSKPQYCPDEIYSLMLSCWNKIPEERPDFVAIKNQITQIIEIFQQKHPIQLHSEYQKPAAT